MSFEAFPADAVQQFNDPGPYYIRENGKLRSPPGLGPHAYVPPEKNQPTKTTNGSDKTPRKLFDMTLDFVAANITLVESLLGFPEIVGQQLFDAAHRHGNLSRQALTLFSDAYGDTILCSVNLYGHHLAVNQQLGCLAVFPCLTELEFGGCRLGDDHEILSVIANCYSLTRLGLASNCLTDVGIQRMTAPLRVLGRGPRNLNILDLAGNNRISDKSASQYLTTYTSLKAIDLSGCTISSVGLHVLKTKLHLETNTSPTASPFRSPIKTVGWASPLVEQWVDSSTQLMQGAKCKASKDRASKATHFYGRARKRLENVLRSTLPIPAPPVFPIIQLLSATTDHNRPASDPVAPKVKGSKVAMNTIDSFPKDGRKEAPRRQELEGNRSKDVELSETSSDKELIGQYTRCAKGETCESNWSGTQQHWSNFEAAGPADKGNQFTVKQEPVRTGKPPARKKIKLCSRAAEGFSDILHDSVRHTESKTDGESANSQLASDQRTTEDESPIIMKGQRSRLDHRRPTKYDDGSRRQHDRARNKPSGNTLWNAMHTEEWG